MNTPLSVSSLNEQIKSLLETTLSSVYVEGEISNLTYHNSGHIYFSIKDEKSMISCVMFRGNAQYLKFRLEVGAKVVLYANLTVYIPRGSYQLIAQKIEPSGVGALTLAYEQLKTKLQIKGYFNKQIKKELPQFPNTIYVVTSNTGAAIEDMKKILAHRYPLAKMILLPTLVQGDMAKNSIVKNIQLANKLASNNPKAIIIVGRGGGSIEDLWGFNEECVADAIFESTTPIISAVGHESDFVISDFVADVRASTPSNAIELATPNIDDLRVYCDNLYDDFNHRYKNILGQKEQILNSYYQLFEQNSLQTKFNIVEQNIANLKSQFNNSFLHRLNIYENKLNNLTQNYKLNQPISKLKKGFVQISKNNSVIQLESIQKDDIVHLEDSNYIVCAKVISKQNQN
jgi:exodeoxyribonuclease VII large subunit